MQASLSVCLLLANCFFLFFLFIEGKSMQDCVALAPLLHLPTVYYNVPFLEDSG